MTTMHALIGASLFMALTASSVSAQDHHEESHHAASQLGDTEIPDAHIHGTAELFVVLEGEQLDIELHSPAFNLLGFEHLASSVEERATVQETMGMLADASNLFQIGGAQCQLRDYEADFSNLAKKVATEAEEPGAADDEGHHEVSHSHEPHHPTHGDIRALYHYRCEYANHLDSLQTSISARFPGITSLQVQWIMNGRQGAATLDNRQHQLRFR